MALPEVAVLNRMALALTLAWQVRSIWAQEMQREKENRSSVGSNGSGGSDPSNVGAQASLMRLLIGLLPEWARFGLWGALHERYSRPDKNVIRSRVR